MAKAKVRYKCESCSYIAPNRLGKCPECQQWNTFAEERIEKETEPVNKRSRQLGDVMAAVHSGMDNPAQKPVPLVSVTAEGKARLSTGYSEMDRVLGGGIVPGEYVLVGGDPGIGKSTLMLQMTDKLAKENNTQKILYIAGEESPYQIKLRAERLEVDAKNIEVYAETNLKKVMAVIVEEKPLAVVVDSIQSVYHPELTGTPGSMSQVRECAGMLMELAKSLEVSIFLVGHVTKEGHVAGPKLLEHTVDAVLYLEGDKYKNLRILRTVKNRFGNTQEIGVFEMQAEGLREVTNPSELFLTQTGTQQQPGSVVVATMEGTRPVLVELQALVGHSTYSSPRRISNGIDKNRLHQIVAVLERRIGLDFSQQDVYVNVVGGLRIDEPAADLGIAMALITSYRNIAVPQKTVFAGEVGLTGEIRPVQRGVQRLQEAERIGFERIVMPDANLNETGDNIQCLNVTTLMDSVVAALGRGAIEEVKREAFVEETV